MRRLFEVNLLTSGQMQTAIMHGYSYIYIYYSVRVYIGNVSGVDTAAFFPFPFSSGV